MLYGHIRSAGQTGLEPALMLVKQTSDATSCNIDPRVILSDEHNAIPPTTRTQTLATSVGLWDPSKRGLRWGITPLHVE